jgi:hypothetical protein
LIDRKVLITAACGINALKIGKPGSAAKFTATATDATHFPGLLPGPYLAHFYLYFKLACIQPYQFSKVNPIVGSIKESSFFTVGLQGLRRPVSFQGLAAVPLRGSLSKPLFPLPCSPVVCNVRLRAPAQYFLYFRANSSTPFFFICTRTSSREATLRLRQTDLLLLQLPFRLFKNCKVGLR